MTPVRIESQKYPQTWRWIPQGCLDEGCTIHTSLHDEVLSLVWVWHGESGEAARLFDVRDFLRDAPDQGREVREWLAQAHAYEAGEGPWK